MTLRASALSPAAERMRLGTVIHRAGPPGDDLIQRCERCGVVLQDYRNAHAVGTWEPHWWTGSVEVQRGQMTATRERPTCRVAGRDQ